MNVRCPHCRASIEIEPLSSEVSELSIDCPGCKTPFSVPLPSPPPDSLAAARDDKTEPMPLPSRFLLRATIVSTTLAVALLAYFYWQERPRSSLPSPTEVTPLPTPETERMPTMARETVAAEVAIPPTPLPPETVDLDGFRPSILRDLRPKLAETIRSRANPPQGVEATAAMIYAYLGGREKNREWIEYAYQTADRLQKKDPGNRDARKAYLLSLLAAGKHESVTDSARELFSSAPDDPIAALALGVSLLERGSSEEGRGVLRDGRTRNPRFFPLLEASARAELDRGGYVEAESLARLLLEMEPKDRVALRFLGRSLEGQKKWGDLVSLYAPLASEDGGDSEIRLSLGRGYRALRRFDESRDQLDAVLKNGPERGTLLAQIQLERGKVEFDRERFAESLPYLLKASELAPTDPPTLLYLAGAYYRNKQYKEAAATYERALSLEPKNDQTERYLAMALLEGGETAKGEAIFKRLLERGKEDPSLYYHLARIREGAGDRSGAVAYLESALRKDPDYRNARILLDKLVGRSTP